MCSYEKILEQLFSTRGNFRPPGDIWQYLVNMEFCSCCPGWSEMARPWLTAIFTSGIQVIHLPQPPKRAPPCPANFVVLVVVFEKESCSVTRLECGGAILAHCNLRLSGSNSYSLAQARLSCVIIAQHSLDLLGSSNPHLSASLTAGTIDVHCAHLIFNFFFKEMRSHYVARAGLKLLISNNPSGFASSSAEIIGISRFTQSLILIYNSLYFLEGLTLSPRLTCSGTISTHCNIYLLGSSNSLASASQVAGVIGMHHQSWLIFVFLVEMGFCHVGQACLKILTLGNPPTSASQSAQITGSHVRGCTHIAANLEEGLEAVSQSTSSPESFESPPTTRSCNQVVRNCRRWLTDSRRLRVPEDEKEKPSLLFEGARESKLHNIKFAVLTIFKCTAL
ncbi:hypothetical protein AAY473_007580 [Plecturocebus cupreus]